MKCQIFFAQADTYGFPIPGTMEGHRTNPCKEGLVELPSMPMACPAGYVQCNHPQGWRFFVQVDKNTGQIKPNSLKSYRGRPYGRCYVEFLKFCPAS